MFIRRSTTAKGSRRQAQAQGNLKGGSDGESSAMDSEDDISNEGSRINSDDEDLSVASRSKRRNNRNKNDSEEFVDEDDDDDDEGDEDDISGGNASEGSDDQF